MLHTYMEFLKKLSRIIITLKVSLNYVLIELQHCFNS
jgi:hypothetical protein